MADKSELKTIKVITIDEDENDNTLNNFIDEMDELNFTEINNTTQKDINQHLEKNFNNNHESKVEKENEKKPVKTIEQRIAETEKVCKNIKFPSFSPDNLLKEIDPDFLNETYINCEIMLNNWCRRNNKPLRFPERELDAFSSTNLTDASNPSQRIKSSGRGILSKGLPPKQNKEKNVPIVPVVNESKQVELKVEKTQLAEVDKIEPKLETKAENTLGNNKNDACQVNSNKIEQDKMITSTKNSNLDDEIEKNIKPEVKCENATNLPNSTDINFYSLSQMSIYSGKKEEKIDNHEPQIISEPPKIEISNSTFQFQDAIEQIDNTKKEDVNQEENIEKSSCEKSEPKSIDSILSALEKLFEKEKDGLTKDDINLLRINMSKSGKNSTSSISSSLISTTYTTKTLPLLKKSMNKFSDAKKKSTSQNVDLYNTSGLKASTPSFQFLAQVQHSSTMCSNSYSQNYPFYAPQASNFNLDQNHNEQNLNQMINQSCCECDAYSKKSLETGINKNYSNVESKHESYDLSHPQIPYGYSYPYPYPYHYPYPFHPPPAHQHPHYHQHYNPHSFSPNFQYNNEQLSSGTKLRDSSLPSVRNQFKSMEK